MSSNSEYNFNIYPSGGTISKRFSELGLKNFVDAADWVHDLPYRRNKDKFEKHTIFNERCGTCSTKHVLLKRLAIENNQHQLKLYLGIYKMSSTNTNAVASCLAESQLSYIPEAHVYLKINGRILDFTGIRPSKRTFDQDLLLETEISPEQIGGFKVAQHRKHIQSWLKKEYISYSFDQLWQIRERCIRAISREQLKLETDRLHLRPFKKEDGTLMYDLNDDAEVLQYTGDVQFSNISAAEDFLDNYDQYERYGVGRMIITVKETAEIVGWCGLKYHPETDEYDIGYRLFKKHWNKGYATESAKACIIYGFNKLYLQRIVGHARTENTASLKVFKKLNMNYQHEYKEEGENWVYYSIDRGVNP